MTFHFSCLLKKKGRKYNKKGEKAVIDKKAIKTKRHDTDSTS